MNKKKMLSKIICFFIGHKVVPMIVESETSICDLGCKRCGAGIGLPYFKNYDCPPPYRIGATPEEKQEAVARWKTFVDEECDRIRRTGNIFDDLWLEELKKRSQELYKETFIVSPSGSDQNGSTLLFKSEHGKE